MKTLVLTTGVLLFCTFYISAQSIFTIKGKIIDAFSNVEIIDATITLQDTEISVKSNLNGEFQLEHVPAGNYILEITHTNYQPQHIPITCFEIKDLNIGTLYFQPKMEEIRQSNFLLLKYWVIY